MCLTAWLLVHAVLCQVIHAQESLPRCDVSCNRLKSAPSTFEIGDRFIPTIVQSCTVKSINQSDICTMDVSDFITQDSCTTQDAELVHYVSLTCESTQFRPVITNRQNTSCTNYIGYLMAKKCGFFWQDLEIYAACMHLNVLFMEGCLDRWDEEIKTTNYWSKSLESIPDKDELSKANTTETLNSTDIELPLISPGLRQVGTLGLFIIESIPHVFEIFVWPLMAEIQIASVHTAVQWYHLNEQFQKTFPRLQTHELHHCDLTEPPHNFPWDEEHLVLPRNLSRTETFNTHYADAFQIRVQRHYYRRVLFLDNNNITDLSEFTFKGDLQKISMKHNRLATVNSNLFINVQDLHSIDLSNNILSRLPSELFRNQDYLLSISLANNLISEIPVGLFQNLPSLRTIDLSFNQIAFLHSGRFLNLPLLESINLASNQIQYISDNAILSSQAFLQDIDLSQNQITVIPTFVFVLRELKNVDLSGNHITFGSIKRSLSNVSSEHIKFVHRESASQYEEDFSKDRKSYTQLAFQFNNISTIDVEALNNDSFARLALFFHYFNLNLDSNDILCDCKVFQFYNYMHGIYGDNKLEPVLTINEHNKKTLKCKKPDNLSGKVLYNLDPKDFLCESNITFCPEDCSCFRRSVDAAIIVDCKGVGKESLPSLVPHQAIELDLSDNTITNFDTAYPYLRQLHKVNLQNNLISSVSTEVLNILDGSQLQELKLDNNRLRKLPEEVNIFKISNLSSLTLGNNPWECDCHTGWMKDWLIVRRDRIQDLDEIMCVTGQPEGQVYIEVKEDQFVCITPASIIVRNALLSVGAVIALLVVAIILIYVYRGEIKILLYVHCNWHPFDATEEADILDMTYDAFISYSGLDYKWVCFDLLPKLENHIPPYKTCVHDRDFMPGAYIEDNIMEAVQTSRRMVLVLSQNYLKSDWCMLEFRAAHNRVLNDRTNYLILVLFDDINVNDLDEDMQLYIRTNTYLARSNKWFYEKLFYSMPTKNLDELRQDMETKTGKVPMSPTLSFATKFNKSNGSQSSYDTQSTTAAELSKLGP